MRNLIKAEWFKLSKSRGYKVLLLCNFASLFSSSFLLVIGFRGFKGVGYNLFVGTLRYVLHHHLIGYLFVSVFLCKEFSNRTFGMSLLCGYPRRKIFMAKVLVLLAGLNLLFLVYIGITTIVVSVGNGGFGKALNIETCKDVLMMMFYGMAGCTTMGAVMILTAVVIKRAFATVGVGMGIMYAFGQMENLTRENPLPFLKYTYLYQCRNLARGEIFVPKMFLAVMLITFILALSVSTFIFERIELK